MPPRKTAPKGRPAPKAKGESRAGKPGTAKPAKPRNAKSANAKTTVAKPASAKPKSAKPTGARPASAKAGSVRPAKAKPYKKPEASRRGASEKTTRVQGSGDKAAKGERIAKIIARAGLCSRRDAERWIAEGRVVLDGKILDTAAVVVKPGQSIIVDGQPLPAPEQARVWRFHKAKGLMTTRKDPEGRPTVFDALPKDLPRLEPIGRLDFNSEGLLLFTNDGELKRRLELPATGWSRKYRVRVHGRVDPAQMKALENGITVEGINYGPIQARLEHQAASNAWIAMTLREGKNREIRRICEHLGLTVNRLLRVSYGPFQLGDLAPGKVEAVPARILRDQLGLSQDEADQAEANRSKSGHSKAPVQSPAGRKTGRSRPAANGKVGAKPGSGPLRKASGSRPAQGATDLTDTSGKKPGSAGRKGLSANRKATGKAVSAKTDAAKSRPRSSKPAKAATGKTAIGKAASARSAGPKRGGKNANRRRTP